MDRTRTLKVAGTFVLILGLSFGLGELALRLYDSVFPSYVFYDVTYDRFRVRPGSDFYGFPVNSRGFHDVEIPPRDPNVFRIAALGDSFAFGIVPYPDNYLTLLEETLDRDGQALEVINMGIPRIGPMDYLALLVNEGLALDPDLVLVSFYIGNDFMETYRALEEGRRLHSHSYVAALVRYALFIRPALRPGQLHRRRTYHDEAPTFDRKAYLSILAGRAKVYLPGWEPGPRVLDVVLETMEEMASICRRRGIGLVVVLIPEEIQIDASLQRELAATYDLYRQDRMDYLLPNRVLGARLEELAIDTLDLYPAFKAASPD